MKKVPRDDRIIHNRQLWQFPSVSHFNQQQHPCIVCTLEVESLHQTKTRSILISGPY